MKSFETQAAHALRSLLLQVPALKLLDIERETARADSGIDFTARIKVAGKRHALVCEANSSGQPRHVRHALLTLRDYMSHHAKDATPVLIEDDAHELNERRTGTHVEGVGSFARRQGRADALTRAVCLDAGALEQF